MRMPCFAHRNCIYSRWTADRRALIPHFSGNHLFVPKLSHEANTHAAKSPAEVKKKWNPMAQLFGDQNMTKVKVASLNVPFQYGHSDYVQSLVDNELCSEKDRDGSHDAPMCSSVTLFHSSKVKTVTKKMAAPLNTGNASCTWKATVAARYDEETTQYAGNDLKAAC